MAETISAHAFGEAASVEITTREIPFTDWARGAALAALTAHAPARPATHALRVLQALLTER